MLFLYKTYLFMNKIPIYNIRGFATKNSGFYFGKSVKFLLLHSMQIIKYDADAEKRREFSTFSTKKLWKTFLLFLVTHTIL